MAPKIEHAGTAQVDGGPEMHCYRLKEGAVIHVNGIPLRLGSDAIAQSATDLRKVPDTTGPD
jgi:hypothetical protein